MEENNNKRNNQQQVEEQQEERPINNVPIEVWIELFKFLDFEWLIVVCRVCKFWKHASFFVLRRLQTFPLQQQFYFLLFFSLCVIIDLKF